MLEDLQKADIHSPEPDLEAVAAAERLRTGRWGYRIAKRAFDVLFSLAVMVAFSWLFLIIAVAVKLDDPAGPVIFRRRRVGRLGPDGEPTYFDMYKFRSMVADAEERLAEPGLPQEVIQYDTYAKWSLTVKPGCGGVWQAGGCSDPTFKGMVDLNLGYIEASMVSYDPRLVLGTIKQMFTWYLFLVFRVPTLDGDDPWLGTRASSTGRVKGRST